jgi:hypothetical protein
MAFVPTFTQELMEQIINAIPLVDPRLRALEYSHPRDDPSPWKPFQDMDSATRQTLRACNLVSRAFHVTTQPLIFNSVLLCPGNPGGTVPDDSHPSFPVRLRQASVIKFKEIALASPRILSLIKRLNLYKEPPMNVFRPPVFWGKGILDMMRDMVNVELLCIDGIRFRPSQMMDGMLFWPSYMTVQEIELLEGIHILASRCRTLVVCRSTIPWLPRTLESLSLDDDCTLIGVALKNTVGYTTQPTRTIFDRFSAETQIYLKTPALKALSIGEKHKWGSIDMEKIVDGQQAEFRVKSLQTLRYHKLQDTDLSTFVKIVNRASKTLTELEIGPHCMWHSGMSESKSSYSPLTLPLTT